MLPLQKSDKTMFRKYFSDYFNWMICVTVLFAISYTLILAGFWSSFWGRYWVVPACYLLILLLIVRYHVLFFVAVKDLKKGRIEEASIIIREIERDKKFNFVNRGGTRIGKEKCLLIDSDGRHYRTVTNQVCIAELHPRGYYRDVHVTVTYLTNSRIVLHMKRKPSKSSNAETQHLRNDFQDYFI